MANFLITGVSSGIGRELTKTLVRQGHSVLGLARRKELLQELKSELGGSSKFEFICVDLSAPEAWQEVVKRLAKKHFIPHTVIFNAAIFEKDYLGRELDYAKMKRSFEINFFSIIRGFEELAKVVRRGSRFLFISSSSALKGSGAEGIGYPASKAALTSAFESLYLKYGDRFRLKILLFGPVDTGMLPSASHFTPVLSKDRAVKIIIKTLDSNRAITYAPWPLFWFLRLIKILPDKPYLTILRQIDILHLKSSKK